MENDTARAEIIAVIVALVVVVGLIGLMYVGMYNNLVSKDVSIEKMKADLESQYQRRADLIPNLVATVQGSAQFEKSTQTEIARLRSDANTAKENMGKAKTPSEIDAADNEMTSVWSRLMVVVEAYPVLQSNQNFRDLQSQLEGTENRIAVARKDFNDSAATYNAKVQRFPSNVTAGVFNFDKFTYFEADPGSQKAPDVTF